MEELEANSDTIGAIDIMKVSLPCAANAIDLFNRHTGWPLMDSRSAGMLALAGLIVRSRMGLVVIENTRGFVTSPICSLIRDLAEAGGGGSFVWVGNGTHQSLPIFGVRAHMFVANAESKHLLAGIEAELRSGKPLPRLSLAGILKGAGNSAPVESGLELLLVQVEHGGTCSLEFGQYTNAPGGMPSPELVLSCFQAFPGSPRKPQEPFKALKGLT